MEILQVILPVFVMISIGMVCKRTQFLSPEGIENIKKLVTKVILPVAIFHALARAGEQRHYFLMQLKIQRL